MKKVFLLTVLALLVFVLPVLAQTAADSVNVPTPVVELSKVLGVNLAGLLGIAAIVSVLVEAGKRLLNLQGKVTLIASGALSVAYSAMQYHGNVGQLLFAAVCLFGFSTGLYEYVDKIAAKIGVGTTPVKK